MTENAHGVIFYNLTHKEKFLHSLLVFGHVTENFEGFTGNIWAKCNTATFLWKDHSLTFDRVTVRLSFPSFPFLPSSHQLPPPAHYFPALLFQKDSPLVWKRLCWLQEKAEGENRRSEEEDLPVILAVATEIMLFLFSWQAAVMSSSSNR